MRIGFFGTGAIGGVIGGYLARAGQDVTLMDMWPANVEAIKRHGLRVTAVEEEFLVHAPAPHLSEVSPAGKLFDAVFLCVKSYDTDWAVQFIRPYLAPGGYVVSAQNSINDDRVAAIVGWPRSVGCIVTFGAEMQEPGQVRRTSDNTRLSSKVGEPSGLVTPRVEALTQALGALGPSKPTTNLWGERWSKLGTNAMANALAGLTGLTSAEIRETPDVRAVSIRVAAEVVTVAQALGVAIEPISTIPAQLFVDSLEDGAVREEVEVRLMEWGKGLGAGRPSLAQDVAKGRRTEVEELNGLVVRKGEEVGVPTPVNRAVLGVTKRVERGELEPDLSNIHLVETGSQTKPGPANE